MMTLWTFGTELPDDVVRDACKLAAARLDQAVAADDILPEGWSDARRQKVERALRGIVEALEHRQRRLAG